MKAKKKAIYKKVIKALEKELLVLEAELESKISQRKTATLELEIASVKMSIKILKEQ